ncbi:MAG: cobalamin-dependent protein [Ginsengibacter sp.]
MKTALININNVIDDNKASLAQLITDLQFKNNPDLLLKYGIAGKEKCCADNLYHLSYLSEAIRIESIEIFAAYLVWAQKMLVARKIPIIDLSNNLGYIDLACKEVLPKEAYKIIHFYILKSKERIKNIQTNPETYFNDNNPLLEDAKKYLDFLLKAKRIQAQAMITNLVKNGNPISSLYDNIFKVTQCEIGLLWQNNVITVAHEHYCTAATQSIMSTLYPHIFTSEKKERRMLACSVSGELHEIGIRMLSDLFEIDGWDTYYMGASMPEADIIKAVAGQNPQLLAISATMSFNIAKVESLIKKIRNNISIANLKIMVGGYPFTLVQDLWRKVGADASAPTAKEAIKIANNMFF